MKNSEDEHARLTAEACRKKHTEALDDLRAVDAARGEPMLASLRNAAGCLLRQANYRSMAATRDGRATRTWAALLDSPASISE